MGNKFVKDQFVKDEDDMLTIFNHKINCRNPVNYSNSSQNVSLYTDKENILFVLTDDDYDYICVKGMDCSKLSTMLKICRDRK